MEIEFERLLWENKELKQRLHRVIKDRKVIETLFEEIEEDHEKALSRIDVLENELQDLKEESMRLNEVLGKANSDCKDYKLHDSKRDDIDKGTPFLDNYGVKSWSTGEKSTGMIVQDLQLHRDSWGGGDKSKPQELSALKPQSVPYQSTPQTFSRNPIVETSLEQRRVVALYRSLFSSILSLLVAMIIWESEDPCMPLVAALFIVVGMSMGSVVQFFSTIKNKPASDAVALLSINWFILGTLTSPSLPRVARMLAPHVVRLADPVIIWLRLS